MRDFLHLGSWVDPKTPILARGQGLFDIQGLLEFEILHEMKLATTGWGISTTGS